MRSSILIAEYVLRSKLQTFHKSSRPPSSTASIAEGGKTWWNFSSWPSQYLLRPSKVLTLAFKHYIGSSCCRRLVVNNLNFHQVNSLLRRDIFFWIWFPHIFRRRFALQRIITTRQDQIRLTRISLLIRHSKLRIYITRHPGIWEFSPFFAEIYTFPEAPCRVILSVPILSVTSPLIISRWWDSKSSYTHTHSGPTVAVSKTRRPFSYNFEVFFDKTAKYWEILTSKETFETTDQA